MSESYTVGADAEEEIASKRYAGQGFTPQENHVLEYIDLNITPTDPKGAIFIRVHHAKGDFTPTTYGGISSGTLTMSRLTLRQTQRLRCKMSPVTLLKGDRYVIICFGPAYPYPSPGTWSYDSTYAQYPRGHRILSLDSGTTWTTYPKQDHIFAEFGTPPLPKPMPPPPIKNFAIPDITQTLTMDGILLKLATTVPCHLTCYWTDKKPRKHHTSRILRGLTVPWGTYFCFVAWHPVEQNEPGDTLYHTFTLEPWPECETRWLTFRGEVDNIPSPSVGPIFQKHCLGPYLFIKNPSFEDWPDPLKPPTHWAWIPPDPQNITATQDPADKTHGAYSLCLQVTGQLGWWRLYQDVDAIPLRGKWIEIRPDMKGSPFYYTGMYVSINGTPPTIKHERPASPDYWSWGIITRKVPLDATIIHIELRCDHLPRQPNTCRFDNLRSIAT